MIREFFAISYIKTMETNEIIIAVVIVIVILYLIFARRSSGRPAGQAKAPSRRVYIDSDSPKLVVFHSPTCGYCRQLLDGPNSVWYQIKRKYDGYKGLVITEIDSQLYPDIARQYGIDGYPTILHFRGPNVIRFASDRTYEALEQFILAKNL